MNKTYITLDKGNRLSSDFYASFSINWRRCLSIYVSFFLVVAVVIVGLSKTIKYGNVRRSQSSWQLEQTTCVACGWHTQNPHMPRMGVVYSACGARPSVDAAFSWSPVVQLLVVGLPRCLVAQLPSCHCIFLGKFQWQDNYFRLRIAAHWGGNISIVTLTCNFSWTRTESERERTLGKRMYTAAGGEGANAAREFGNWHSQCTHTATHIKAHTHSHIWATLRAIVVVAFFGSSLQVYLPSTYVCVSVCVCVYCVAVCVTNFLCAHAHTQVQ